MYELSIKVPIRKKSGNLFNDPRVYIYIYLYTHTHTHTHTHTYIYIYIYIYIYNSRHNKKNKGNTEINHLLSEDVRNTC